MARQRRTAHSHGKGTAQGDVFHLYGIKWLKELDMSNWGGYEYIYFVGSMPTLEKLIIGGHRGAAPNVEDIVLGSNTPSLKYIDITNIPISNIDLSNCIYLETLIARKRYITGYSFNRNLIPSPNLFVDSLHKKGVRVGLNINPIEGIHPHEEMYQKVLEYIKVPPNTTIKFVPYDVKFLDIFLKILIHPLEQIGTDFFWLDYTNADKLGQFMLSHYMYLDSGRSEAKRNMLITRNPYVASHRYGVLYSGRSKVNFDTLRQLPYINTNTKPISNIVKFNLLGIICIL